MHLGVFGVRFGAAAIGLFVASTIFGAVDCRRSSGGRNARKAKNDDGRNDNPSISFLDTSLLLDPRLKDLYKMTPDLKSSSLNNRTSLGVVGSHRGTVPSSSSSSQTRVSAASLLVPQRIAVNLPTYELVDARDENDGGDDARRRRRKGDELKFDNDADADINKTVFLLHSPAASRKEEDGGAQKKKEEEESVELVALEDNPAAGIPGGVERTEKILATLEELKRKLRELGTLMTGDDEDVQQMRQGGGALGISLDATSVLALLTMGAYLIRVVLSILHVSRRSLSSFQPFEVDAIAPVMGQFVPESVLEWLAKSVSTPNERARSMNDLNSNVDPMWSRIARVPSELQATWDLSKRSSGSACLKKFVCRRLTRVHPRKRHLGDDLMLLTMSGIAHYNGNPINKFVDEIDNKLALDESVNCDAMFADGCPEREYREGLLKGQMLGKVQTFVARWWST